MLFGRFYIKNYHANYNSYFPLKVKGLIVEKIFLCMHIAQRLLLEQSVSHEFCQNHPA